MIAVACDHAAVDMKKEILSLLTELGYTYHDFGTYDTVSCDYPVLAVRAANAVVSGECERGILICGTGIGMSLAANKVKGVRCACCSEPYSARMTRLHNDANMLAFGARVVGVDLAKMIVRTFLETSYEGGRHQRRVDMLTVLENGGMLE